MMTTVPIQRRCSLLVERHWSIFLVLVAFPILGGVYSLVTPLFEAPDELLHYAYIQHLAQGKGLPVTSPQTEEIWQQEGSQPPLYYALVALSTAWIPQKDFFVTIRLNPHTAIGEPHSTGNKNRVLHTSEESFPYRGLALVVHIGRLWSVCMGAVTVLCTYLIARELFPDHLALAALAAMVVAFNPQFLFINGAINNDNMATATASLALLMAIAMLNNQAKPCHLVLLGVVLGLAALSKLNNLGLLPVIGVLLLHRAWRQRSLRLLIKEGLIVYGVATAVAGWWYLRNQLLYGDPLGWGAWEANIILRSRPPTLEDLWGELAGFEMSFWAIFGWMNIVIPEGGYWLLRLLTRLAALGLVLWIARGLLSRQRPAYQRTVMGLVLLGLWLAILLLAWLSFMLRAEAAQGRYLFPAIASIATFLSLGLTHLVPHRHASLLAGLVGSALFVFAALSPFLFIAPAYARPPKLEANTLISHPLEASFGKLLLLGYDVDRDEASPGETVHLTLYWKALAPIEKDYSVFVHLLDECDLVLGQLDTHPGLGNFPTSQWRPGEIVADRYPVNLSAITCGLEMTQWEVGLYEYATRARLPVAGSDNVRFPGVRVTCPAGSRFPNPSDFDFEGQIALVGHELDHRVVQPGETLHLTLYWQALASVEQDYTVFTHVVGEGNRIWAQRDDQPQGGAAPTSGWERGQVIEDRYELRVQEDTPAGIYDLEIGLYSADTGRRLEVLDDHGRPQDNRVLLTKVRVLPVGTRPLSSTIPFSDLSFQHFTSTAFGQLLNSDVFLRHLETRQAGF